MSMGIRNNGGEQGELWLATRDLPTAPSHPFYAALNRILDAGGFDGFVEECSREFYAPVMGRPGLAPGVYFRTILIGYFEGIDSERGIAWRIADSRSLSSFLGLSVGDRAPDHSTLSKTRKRIDLETHGRVFDWVLSLIAREGLLKGKTIGVDATTLEANAAMRSIVRRDTGETYRQYLIRLARESGIETPTAAELAKIDKTRKNKASNADWEHPHDPDARVMKLKNGSTHMGYKAEHAVDLETGALVSATLHSGDAGDTSTLGETIDDAESNLENAAKDEQAERRMVGPTRRVSEVVSDKGYHSSRVLKDLEEDDRRSYIPEPDRGRRNWAGRWDERERVYGNRRRTGGKRGKALMRLRAEKNERSFAHMYTTGGMRKLYLRGRENILKRLLIHACGFNLALVMMTRYGAGKPRQWAALKAAARTIATYFWHWTRLIASWRQRIGRTGFAGAVSTRFTWTVSSRLPRQKWTLQVAG